ncbi:MAG: pseudaminic acid biosynthesis-associated methylase [Acaryochloris sp. RU_4_1]|nr:pseudaminic acid biosynthesis-associated methylase [Acaryochloris sp. RU_4_1]NJR53995.1 pseudaminic acid biosynthesis-associated methylase [Acaryochloris sp. CRU_2_0]
MTEYLTEQENFWAGIFGTEYIRRNDSKELLASNLSFFSRTLSKAGALKSCLEFGANIGMNLRAIQLLYPNIELSGVEINKDAAKELSNFIGDSAVFNGSILDYPIETQSDLVLVKGVLIHINPDQLESTYKKIYEAAKQNILICEYYNPSPVSIPYRGHRDRLFKRDFSGEMLDMFTDLELIDYGFVYHRDLAFPQDDINWFLIKKRAKNA